VIQKVPIMPISPVPSSISAALPALARGVAPSAAPPLPSMTPSDLAAARFKAMMGAEPAAEGAASNAAGAQAAAAVSPDSAAAGAAAGGPVMGDRILHGLGTRVSEVSQRWHDLAARTRTMAGTSDPAAYMQAQMDLLSLSVSAELVSKVSGRVVQNIDVLVKNP
jgi:type III secretion system YscI/HrpB-like protein